MTQEIYRKAFHLVILLIPITYYFLGKWPSLLIFAPITMIIVSLDYARRTNPKLNEFFIRIFGPLCREHELTGEQLCGVSWVGLSACICFFFFKEEIAVPAFLILAISDFSAALVGKAIPSQPFFEKSILGSSAFFFSGLVILISCGIIFHSRPWFYIFGFFALFCVTIIEARPSLVKIDDNFSIPVGFGIIMTFFDLVWNYNY